MNKNFFLAFDLILDKTKALEDLIELGFARVLTAGCGTDALNGVQQLSLLVKQVSYISFKKKIF